MTTKKYPKGLMAFKPNEKAPIFVKASVLINPKELYDWIKENNDCLTEYKGQKQLKLQLLESDKGLYFNVDTYKPKQTNTFEETPFRIDSKDDMPF